MIKYLILALLSVSCISNPKPDFDPTLIGGSPADMSQFTASINIRSGNSSCSATVVGPQVVASAAHCMPSGGTISFRAGGKSYTAVCTHSRAYSGNSTADYALCKTNEVVTGIKYDDKMIEKNPKLVVGAKVLLSGYGCTRPGGGGGNDGIYRICEAQVSRLPRGSDNDIVTINPSGPACALCFGDSGGPAYFYDGDKRWKISDNSRGDISRTSYLSANFTDEGKRFTLAWLEANSGMQICGVTPNTPNCRNAGSDPKPEPEPKPEVPCKEAILAFDAAKKKVDEAYEGMLKCAQQ